MTIVLTPIGVISTIVISSNDSEFHTGFQPTANAQLFTELQSLVNPCKNPSLRDSN